MEGSTFHLLVNVCPRFNLFVWFAFPHPLPSNETVGLLAYYQVGYLFEEKAKQLSHEEEVRGSVVGIFSSPLVGPVIWILLNYSGGLPNSICRNPPRNRGWGGRGCEAIIWQ